MTCFVALLTENLLTLKLWQYRGRKLVAQSNVYNGLTKRGMLQFREFSLRQFGTYWGIEYLDYTNSLGQRECTTSRTVFRSTLNQERFPFRQLGGVGELAGLSSFKIVSMAVFDSDFAAHLGRA